MPLWSAEEYCGRMSPIVHLTISVFIAFCLGLELKRKYLAIFLLGIIGVMPDIDHFLPMIGGFSIFHNTFFMGIVPLALLIFAHIAETRKTEDSSEYQRFLIGATVVLLGHLLLDLIDGSSIQLSLLSTSVLINVPEVAIIQSQSLGILFSTSDLLWLALFVAVLLGNRVISKVYDLYEGWNEDNAVMNEKIPSVLSRNEPFSSL